MAIALVAAPTVTEQGTSGTSTMTVSYPATVNAGEVLVLSAGTGDTTFTISGWTQIGSTGTTTDAANMYYKIAVGNEGGTTFNITVLAGRATVSIARYSGVDLVTPIDVAASTANGTTGSSLNVTGITTTKNGCMLVSTFSGNSAQSLSYTQPTSFTLEARNTNGSGAAIGKAMAYADLLQGAAGATGTLTWSWSPSSGLDMRIILGALRPATSIPNKSLIVPNMAVTRASFY
jgi:hypothetical protein